MAKGYRIIPVNLAHAGKLLLGQQIYASLADIEEPVDVVDMFRTPDAASEIVRQAIAIGAKVMWMQLGIRNDQAAKIAEDAGLKVVMNRCPKIEYGRLSGEIGWVGVNRRVIDNRKPFLFGQGGTMKHRA
jgi:predicted CoA-binding protein